MGRISIMNSEIHGDNLTCGWDVSGNCYFVLLDNNTEEPAYWKPVINSINGVVDAFKELREKMTATLREALVDQRMGGDERRYFYDSIKNTFIDPRYIEEDKDESMEF